MDVTDRHRHERKRRRTGRRAALAPAIVLALIAGLGAGLGATLAQNDPPVGVRLELSQKFFYAGEPLWVRTTVRNGGDSEIENPLKTPLVKGFRVDVLEEGGERALPAAEKPGIAEPARPAKLGPRSFYGAVLDLTRIFPELAEAGTYRIRWSGDGVLSDLLTVRVIPKYDATKRYSARIETSEGPIRLGFFPESAPIAVKAFIDMAHAGFYDGLQIHEAQPDTYVAGGNPAFGEPRERHPFSYPAEQTRLPLVSGTVIVKPVGASPPANGPEFVILLKPQPAWAGQVTVLGQVVEGFDVAQKISRMPTTGQKERPFFKPLKDVTIRAITVTEIPTGPPQGAPNSGKTR